MIASNGYVSGVGVGGLSGQVSSAGNGGNGLILLTAFAPCAAGSYFSTATSSCVLCAAGTFSSVKGLVGYVFSPCLACSSYYLGYTSNAGSTSCTITITDTPFAAVYTGAMQTYLVPKGVLALFVQQWGPGGGGGSAAIGSASPVSFGGGAGGYSECFILVTPQSTLNILVGGGGGSNVLGGSSAGGLGGGGAGVTTVDSWNMGGGGGRCAIQNAATATELMTTAGGGGGGALQSGVSSSNGGGGGGGLAGLPCPASGSIGGYGGSQSQGEWVNAR